MQFLYWKNQSFLNLSIATLAGIGIALAVLFLEPVLVLAILAAIISAAILVLYPELGFIGILFLLSSILGEEQIPTIDIGLQIYLSDLIFIALVAVMAIRLLADPDFILEKNPLTIPLLLFWGLALISTVIHILDQSVVIGSGIHEMRIISYYLLIIPFTQLIRTKKQLDRLLNILFLLATVSAAANVLQYILGDNTVFLTGRVEEFSDGVYRITSIPNEGLITATFIVLTVHLFLSNFNFNKVLNFAQWAIIFAAMIVSFNRTHWGIAAISLLITFLLVNVKQRTKIITWGLSLLWITLIILLPAFFFRDTAYSSLVDAAFIRISSVFSSASYVDPTESTIMWRNFEYEYGIPQILNNPLFGLGMGANFRPYLSQIDGWGSMGPHYTHNGHLWIAMKAGLLSWFSLLAFMGAFIVEGFKKWRNVIDSNKQSLALGFTLVGVSIVIGSILHPIIMTLPWTPLLGIIFGINHVIFKLYLKDEQSS